MLSIGSTGRGPALDLTVIKGKVPLEVNSSAQVPNLNVSLLGGLPAGSFVQDSGQVRSYAVTANGDTERPVTLLSLPGYGTLSALCVAGEIASVSYEPYMNGSQAVTVWNGGSEESVAADGSQLVLRAEPTGSGQIMIDYPSGSDAAAVQHVAAVTMEGSANLASVTCDFVATAVIGGGSSKP
jgi:hypothetical protein